MTQTQLIHLGIILLAYIITWGKSVKCGFVSDDHEGIERFSDHMVNNVPSYTYEENGKTWRNGQFNNSISFPYSVIRWLRINFGRKFCVIGKNEKGHDIYGYQQSPFKHHLLNLILHSFNILLTYIFLNHLFGEKLAFLTTLIFAVNPVSSQCVMWVSGFGYLLSYFGIILTLNLSFFSSTSLEQASWMIPISITHYLSMVGMLAGFLTPLSLLLLGKPILAIPTTLISLITLYMHGRRAVAERRENFIKQNMWNSVFFNWRKPFVVLKTFYYYVKMIIFPIKLGLFHEWGYTYDEKMERFDGMAFKGLLCAIAFILGIIFLPVPIKFGLIWFVLYLALFLNFITAQQFVVDRYLFIPSLCISIIYAFALQSCIPLFYVLVGLFIMRTWLHRWTFDNEIRFYLSNCLNFHNSEVAWGNLGVAYAQSGWQGSAFDAWQRSATINPFYSVPHYNLYNIYKLGGSLELSKQALEKCLNSKTVQFKEIWQKELDDLNKLIEQQKAAQCNLVASSPASMTTAMGLESSASQ